MKDFDRRAAEQIFIGEGERRSGILSVPRDTENPIDIRLRQIAMSGETPNIKAEFVGKNVAVIAGNNQTIYTGKLKDIFADRSVRVKSKTGLDIIVPFGSVIELSDFEL